MTDKQGFIAIFGYVDDFLSALRSLKGTTYRIETAFSPLRLSEIQEILGKKPSVVRLITLFGGVLSGLGLIALAVYAHHSFKLITGGKPVLPWVPWVVVCFEGTILGAVLSAVTAWILKGHLPRLKPPAGYDVRFSQDRFGILVAYADGEREAIMIFLKEAGAEEVRHVVW